MDQGESPEFGRHVPAAGLEDEAATSMPAIARYEVWPYPDLDRLWVRIEMTPTSRKPNLTVWIEDPDGVVSTSLTVVAAEGPYFSLTLHLRRSPKPGQTYRIGVQLDLDEGVVDRLVAPFDLVHRDPAPGAPG